MHNPQLPLAGIKVLDLSRVLAGPFCCQLLADLGADVVKVERPGRGDDTRQWGPPFAGKTATAANSTDQPSSQPTPPDGAPSGYFLSCNRGKRSLTLDLGHPASRPVLEGLAKNADVLVENFRSESLEKLGLTPDDLRQINPRLVSCSISGYGRSGPQAGLPGYDLVMQAVSGLMSITGEPAGTPMKVGVAISDVVAGLFAAVSVLSGLQARRREATAKSPLAPWAFDVALADCSLASLVNVAQASLLTRQRPVRYGNAHPQIVPYQAFQTADGWAVLAVGNDQQWQHFCVAAGRDDLAGDSRFSTNPLRVEHRDELIRTLEFELAKRTTAAWQQLLEGVGVPVAPVLALDEVLASEQVTARGMVVDPVGANGQYQLLGCPVHWTGQPARDHLAPPELGQHTDEVLREWLGYTDAQIQSLTSSGAVSANEPRPGGE